MEFKIGDLVKIKGAGIYKGRRNVVIDISYYDKTVLIEFPDSSTWWYDIDQIELNYQLIRENKLKELLS